MKRKKNQINLNEKDNKHLVYIMNCTTLELWMQTMKYQLDVDPDPKNDVSIFSSLETATSFIYMVSLSTDSKGLHNEPFYTQMNAIEHTDTSFSSICYRVPHMKNADDACFQMKEQIISRTLTVLTQNSYGCHDKCKTVSLHHCIIYAQWWW